MAGVEFLDLKLAQTQVESTLGLVEERGQEQPVIHLYDAAQVVADLEAISLNPEYGRIARLLKVRFQVEASLAQWVANQPSLLERVVDELEHSKLQAASASFYAADEAFHVALMQIAGATGVAELIQDVMDLEALQDLSNSLEEIDREAVVIEHTAIVSAIARQDPFAIDVAFQIHLLNSLSRLRQLDIDGCSEFDTEVEMEVPDIDEIIKYLESEFGELDGDFLEDIEFVASQNFDDCRDAATRIGSLVAQRLHPDKFVLITFEPDRFFGLVGPFHNSNDADSAKQQLLVESIRYFSPPLDVAEEHCC